MDGRLIKSIDEYGGKFGPLVHIRDYEKDGKKLVPPLEIFSMGDFMNGNLEGHIRSVKNACNRAGLEYAILRTGMKGFGDFKGLVDVFPTIQMISLSKLDSDYLRSEYLPQLINIFEDPWFEEYLNKEGVHFDMKNVVLGLMPQYTDFATTVTEHPNLPQKVMVDIWHRIGHPIYRRGVYDAVDYFDDNPIFVRKPILKVVEDHNFWNASELRHAIQEMGILDHEVDAYQFEMIPDQTGDQKIVQIRYFARRRLANFHLEPTTGAALTDRVFGVTGKDGVVLPWLDAQRREHAEDFENANPEVPYILGLVQAETHRELELWHKFDNMRGYSVTKRFLAHQNTRFVKDALRRENGFAFLRHVNDVDFETGTDVLVISDGQNIVMERA